MFEGFKRREKKLVPEFVPDENLDRLAVEYTEAVQELIRCKMDDPHDHLGAAQAKVEQLDREHGVALRAYLRPYMDFPSSYFTMPKEEYPR